MSRLMEDLSSFPSTASTSLEDHENSSGSTSSRKLRVTLLSSEWRSTKGGLSTINRELAIQLAKHPSVEVSVYLPQCSEEDKQVARYNNVRLIKAREMLGLEPNFWLSCLPEDHAVDCVIGHGALLGQQVQFIKRTHPYCKWIQVVHTAPEELGMYKEYEERISKGEKKHQVEVELCKLANQVVAVGPKLAEAFSGYLRPCGKDQDVLNLTPGIFSEFADVKQASQELGSFSVLVFGRGDSEDFQLKGYDIAAQAISELKDMSYKLVFVGATSGEEEKVADVLLKQGIDRSQLRVRRFNESREKLADLFCEVDLAIMPSRTEGFGLAALEALSAGLPVLVSGNSGFGEALKKVPFASSCVVQSEDPKDWANAIKAVRGKDRKLRLKEAKILQGAYAEVYSWQDHCNRLVERMLAISQGPTADEQNLSKKVAVICQDEKPSPSEKRLHKENLDIRIDFVTKEQGASPTQNVNLEEKVVTKIYPSTQEVMNLITAERFKTINPSNPEEVNGFLQYMKEVRQLLIVDVKTGSLIIKVQASSLHILDELWRDYCTGHLTEVAQKYLVTEDILNDLGLDSVQLTLTINEEEYRAYRKHLLRNEGPNTDEQQLSKKASVICQVEKPSSSEKRLQKGAGAGKTAKRSTSSRKGKRPLSSCAVPALKQPKLLKEEGWNNSVVVELLKAEYKRRCLLKPLLWDSTIELPLENVYTRLKIISRRKLATQMEAKAKVNMFHVIAAEKGADVLTLAQGSPDLRMDVNNELNMFDFFKAPDKVEDVTRLVERQKQHLVRGNDEVNVTEIFKTLEKGKDVMALVEGSPGIGKTTFCLKLAYDCTHEKIPTECSFPKFEVVLLLKCRDIDGNIMDTIREQLLPSDIEEKTVEKLLHFLKDIHNQEKILIILDGLDELPKKSRHHIDELLHRRIFPFCYVLATTRQERGIEARKTFVFDIHLEIKGYTESDSIAYVRRHFETIGQSPKGEWLIEEMQQNTFLNALRNNPLNLLLLCVVYEDYEGKLPTSRTELYQVIVQCLLRRYCAKRNLPAPEDDSVLEKKFEKEILALGELAWLCLLSDRYGFRENELVEFERKYPGLVARELGLLYKEESLKRLKPQHEYCFLHKTFQEYVAAAYIAEKLVNQQFNVFDHFPFADLVTKYPQVFIFVSGMLGEKATVLFTQIGEDLKKNRWDWNWNCNEKEATFFIQSFSESGHAEQMAATLCNFIPFPKVITLDLRNSSFVEVLMACKSLSNLQIPVELYGDTCSWEEGWCSILDYIESFPQPTVVTFVCGKDSLTSSHADRLCKWFSATKSLSEFTLKFKYYITREDCNLLAQIGHGLASCRTLTKVTFSLSGHAYSEGFFNALETGLTTLTSVVLELNGSMRYTATRALQNFLSNKSLNSVSLCIVGGVHDLLVTAVSEALARQTVLKSLDLHLGGPLSSSSASFLEKALMENRSLNKIRLCVHGELPGNWHSVVENLRLAKKSPVCCSIYPNTFNNVADNDFHPVLVRKGLNVKQHLTVNVWGEMKCEAAEGLCEVLAPSSITVFTLNVRGNLTSEVSNSLARCLEENKTLSSLSINIWGELTTEEGIVPSSLSKNSRVQLNLHDLRIGPDESTNVLVMATDNPAALRAFFTPVQDRTKEKICLTVNNDSYVTKEWTRCLGSALAENTSLTSLDLTVNSFFVDADLGEDLGNSLLQSTSLTSLCLTFNCGNLKEGWECKLGERLTKMRSLTTLSLELNEYSEEDQEDCLSRILSLDDGEENQENCLTPTILSNVLVAIKSLSSLSIANIHSVSMALFWNEVVDDCLRECTSLKKLSLTFDLRDFSFCRFCSLDGLATTASLNSLSLAIFVNSNRNFFSNLFTSLNHGFSLNASVNILTVTVTVDDIFTMEEFPSIFKEEFSQNKSVTTLSLTVNEYGEGVSHIRRVLNHCGVFEHLTRNTSVTTFNLTLNSSKEVSDDWLPGLCNAVNKNSSLTTLRLKVNNHCATGESCLYDFSNLLIESRSLSLLELDVSFYGKESGCHKVLIQ